MCKAHAPAATQAAVSRAKSAAVTGTPGWSSLVSER
jgi:hypothetical protein